MEKSPAFGVVVIGRNEGERLKRCFQSLHPGPARIVYVDSGSSDRSVELARRRGIEVVELDVRAPFTAARARNEGFRRLRERNPALSYVQFVDGDCEVFAGWFAAAIAWLDEHHDVAVVCGRRRERHPRASVYNLLCDIEWDTPLGEARACGGDAMMRARAFEALGGFRADLIAGEEPELCLRLRGARWKIWRLDADMTVHDAAMKSFAQWWRRAQRGGYAYAQAVDLHGKPPERQGVRESRSIWLWAFAIPAVALAAALVWGAPGLAVLVLYPLQVVRLALRGRRSRIENWWRAFFLVLGKFPEWLGQLKYLAQRGLGATPRLIEYK